jgi:hypothetical protein
MCLHDPQAGTGQVTLANLSMSSLHSTAAPTAEYPARPPCQQRRGVDWSPRAFAPRSELVIATGQGHHDWVAIRTFTSRPVRARPRCQGQMARMAERPVAG